MVGSVDNYIAKGDQRTKMQIGMMNLSCKMEEQIPHYLHLYDSKRPSG